MDSDAIEREDRLARYVLTGLIVTVCTWALTLMGAADAVIPYVLPPAILILCGRYILVGSISDVEPQAKALAPWWEVSLWAWWLPAAAATSSPRYLPPG